MSSNIYNLGYCINHMPVFFFFFRPNIVRYEYCWSFSASRNFNNTSTGTSHIDRLPYCHSRGHPQPLAQRFLSSTTLLHTSDCRLNTDRPILRNRCWREFLWTIAFFIVLIRFKKKWVLQKSFSHVDFLFQHQIILKFSFQSSDEANSPRG